MHEPPFPPTASTPSLLRPGRNCWRLATAGRAAFLIDGSAFFRAACRAIEKARHSVLLLAWDFDPRTSLGPHGAPAIGALLEGLAASRPALRVRVLRWRVPLPMGMRRPTLPLRVRNALAPPGLRYADDDDHPPGACHHQKLLVVDDAVAFCGGMDFTGSRWDTPAHLDRDPRRRRPLGVAYGPRHDVMMAVDGEAARALAELARARWRRATGESLEAAAPSDDPWPDDLAPDAEDAVLGIARTLPRWRDLTEVREIERLHLDSIAAARRWIYLENQYFTAPLIADALCRRLAEADGPEIVLVVPRRSPSWQETKVMDSARALVLARLLAADRHRRLRILHPVTTEGHHIDLHSKVAVIDDRLLRIGSANLSNRSLGFDSECDLALEAREDAAARAIRHFLCRLLGEHVGVPPTLVGERLARTDSLLETLDALGGAAGRRLQPYRPPRLGVIERAIGHRHLFDPHRRADAWMPWRRRASARFPRRLLFGGVAAVALAAVLWRLGGAAQPSSSG